MPGFASTPRVVPIQAVSSTILAPMGRCPLTPLGPEAPDPRLLGVRVLGAGMVNGVARGALYGGDAIAFFGVANSIVADRPC